MKLKGKVAIVTGGGRGIGREIAILYAEEGANLVVAARTITEIEAVADEVRTLGRKALAIPVDVGDEGQVSNMVRRTLDEFGRVDILVNNAGGPLGTTLRTVLELTLREWQNVLNINLTGTFLCSRAVIPQMIAQKGGVIINVSSAVAKVGRAGYAAYSAAKFGVEGLTQVLAAELAGYNIRANAFWPGGVVATRPLLELIGDPRYEAVVRSLVRTEVVRPVALFLAGDDSAGITGQSINCVEWNKAHGLGDASAYVYKQ